LGCGWATPAAVAALVLLIAACTPVPSTPLAGPDPANPRARVPALAYRSPVEPYVSRRPVDPLINRTSRFVEDQVVALLQNGQPLTAHNLKLIHGLEDGSDLPSSVRRRASNYLLASLGSRF